VLARDGVVSRSLGTMGTESLPWPRPKGQSKLPKDTPEYEHFYCEGGGRLPRAA
jgi:hypothetical protein